MHKYKPVDYIKDFTVANIYPVANQDVYKDEKYIMLLAHLLKYYKKENLSEDSYRVIDNGLYEESQISTDVQYIIDKVEASEIDVDEFIVPDVLNEVDANIEMFKANLPTIRKYVGKYNFMFVAQSTTIEELKKAINFINSFHGELPNISVGFSKLSPLDRMDDEVIEIWKTCKYPIHVLGICTTWREVDKLKTFCRGNDTSQLVYMVKNETAIPEDPVDYTRSGRREDGRGVEGVDIELETDVLDSSRIREFREAVMPALGLNY